MSATLTPPQPSDAKASAPQSAVTDASGLTRRVITRRLLAFGRPLLPVLAFSTLMRITQMLLGIALFGVAAYGVGEVLEDPAAADTSTILWWMVGLALAKGLIRYLEQFSGHYVAFRLLAMLRGYFYDRLEPQAPAGVESRRTGDLLARVTKDIDRVEVFYAHTIAPAISATSVPIIVLVWLGIAINPWIALALLPFLLGVGIVAPLASHKAATAAAGDLRRERGELAAHLSDSVQGVREVLAFGYVERRSSELMGLSNATGLSLTRMGKHIASRRGANELLVALGMVAVFSVGVWQFNDGAITWQQLAVALAVALPTFLPVLGVEEFISDLEQAFAGARRIWEITDAAPVVADAPGAQSQRPGSSLSVQSVTFAYGDGPNVVDHVSFDVPSGSRVAIVGPSGSGKSTLVSLLLRVWDPAAGSVRLGGVDLRDLPLVEVRDMISVVSQRTYLFNDTIAGNLRIANPAATQEELEDACRTAALHDTITAMPEGYDTVVGEMGERLSGGQRQRLALARAVLKNAPVLILDEATSSLDVQTEAQVQHEIDAVASGRTVVMVAHRLSTVTEADLIVVMENGQIVESGVHGDLVAQGGLYSRLWQTQMSDLNTLLG